MKRPFLIPVTLEMCGMISIEAETAEEAIQIAEDNIDDLPIPSQKEYVDGSYQIESDPEIVQMYSDDKNPGQYSPEVYKVPENKEG